MSSPRPSSLSRRAKAGIVAAAIVPALAFAPAAVADDNGNGGSSQLPTGALTTDNIAALSTVGSALQDAGVSISDIVEIYSALDDAGVPMDVIIDVLLYVATSPTTLAIVLNLIEIGAPVSQILALLP